MWLSVAPVCLAAKYTACSGVNYGPFTGRSAIARQYQGVPK